MDASFFELVLCRNSVDRYGVVPLLMIMTTQDQVGIREVLLVNVDSEHTLASFRASTIAVVIMDIEPLAAGIVAVCIDA